MHIESLFCNDGLVKITGDVVDGGLSLFGRVFQSLNWQN